MSDTSYEIRTAPTTGLRWLTGLAVAVTGFMVFLLVAGLVAILTQTLSGTGVLAGLVVAGVGGWGVLSGVRWIRGLREVAVPQVLGRLDAEGLHVHQGLGVPDLPEHLAWSTVPWGWVASVTHSTLDLRTVKAMGAGEAPLEVLRFALRDDRLLDGDVSRSPELGMVAQLLGLTPSQLRTTFVSEARTADRSGAAAWLAVHRPELPVVSGTSLPWWTRATPDAWPDDPRIAVVGAHGRLGRHVVGALAHREKAAPIALVRNEAHRATLEALGAEVRMVDLDQGPRAVAAALRGAAGVVHLADHGGADVLEGARLAGADRFVLVTDGAGDLGAVASSGLAWTAFRPSLLTDAAPTGEVALGPDVTPGPVPRADLAEVLVASIRDEASSGAVWPIAGQPASEPR